MNVGEQWLAGRLAVVRTLARLPAAAFPLIVAGTYGASSETDVFFLVYAGVLFVTQTFALVETAVVPFVPTASRRNEAEVFIATLFGRVALLLAPFTIALATGALLWRHAASAADWGDGWLHLLILAWLPITHVPAAVLSGYLNAGGRFLIPACAMGVRGLATLAVGLGLSPVLGLAAYSAGIVCGEIIALAWLFAASRVRLSRLACRAPESIRPFWTLFLSLLAGGVANSSKGFVDRFVASLLGPGAVSILEYAERLFLMTVSVLGAPLATVLLSRWAAVFNGASVVAEDFRRALRKSQRVALVLGSGIVLLVLAVYASPLGQAAVDRVAADDGHLIWLTLGMYFLGAVPYLLGLVATQAILVIRDARFVTTIAVVAAISNVPLDLIGIILLGLPGIALASTILHVGYWVATEHRLHARAAAPLPLADGRAR
jgi:putative peptidoglycan lipid II flippase